MSRRILVTARNSLFPSLGDGNHNPVHSQDTPAECSAAGADPRTAYGAGRAPLHLASLRDAELAHLVRVDEAATVRELELAGRVMNLLDELEAETNRYKGDYE